MKKLILLIAIPFIFACSKDDGSSSNTDKYNSENGSNISGSDKICGNYKGNTLYKGVSGGCYYINKNKNKTYIDKSNCKC